MSPRKKLTFFFNQLFQELDCDSSLGDVKTSDRPDLADFQCNGALQAAKIKKQNPKILAEQIKNLAEEKSKDYDFSIAGPGFINIVLKDQTLINFLNDLHENNHFGFDPDTNPQKIIIDYGGQNIAKPMHVGHLRSSVIGQALKRLLRFTGNEVLGDIHMGDWGTQMGMLIVAIQEKKPDLPYFDASFSVDYPKESPVTLQDLDIIYPDISARCKADPELAEKARLATFELQKGRRGFRALWQHFVDISIADLKTDLKILDVDFEQYFGESRYQERAKQLIAKLEAQKIAVKSDGALIIEVAQESDKTDMPPLLLRKKDGALIYASTDMACIQERVDVFGANKILYVVDQRQALHFEQVFRAANIAGLLKGAHCQHLGFGTVNGPDGKPFKTRSGGAMKLKDLIQNLIQEAKNRLHEEHIAENLPESEFNDIAQKVAMATLKFGDLQHDRVHDYIFDIQKFSRFEGKTGPYLLYASVRIKSLLKQAEIRGFKLCPISELNAYTRSLGLLLLHFPEYIERAAHHFLPSVLCDYAYLLAKEFSRFYTNCHVLSEENENIRGSYLTLASLTLGILTKTLDILGIESPERM
jgi:arginyl-tRNA synthetase